MADQFASLEEAIRQARAAAAFIDQAKALIAAPADSVKFCCANPPYAGVFEITLPRAVWGPELQAQVDAANATIDAATSASQSMTRSLDAAREISG